MDVGIFGGSFNPIHKGHLHVAREVLRRRGMDRILFVPSRHPPHKSQEKLMPSKVRAEILEEVLSDEPQMEVSRIEVKREGISYTIDTLRELKENHPDWNLFFIIGSDMLDDLHTWKEIHQIMELCQFIIVERPNYPINWEELTEFSPQDREKLKGGVVSITPVDISSSEVREKIEKGEEISHLVPRPVNEILPEN